MSNPIKQYHACGRCHREFYSDQDFFAHPCMAAKIRENGGKATPSSIAPEPVTNGKVPKDAIHYGAETAIQIQKERNASTEEELSAEDVNVKTLSRLAATKELTEMKHALADKGIDCGTWNADETKAAYDKMMQEEAQKVTTTEKVKEETPKKRTEKKSDKRG